MGATGRGGRPVGGATKRAGTWRGERAHVPESPRKPEGARANARAPSGLLYCLSGPAAVRQNVGRIGLNQGVKPAAAARASPMKIVAAWNRPESLLALRTRAAPM